MSLNMAVNMCLCKTIFKFAYTLSDKKGYYMIFSGSEKFLVIPFNTVKGILLFGSLCLHLDLLPYDSLDYLKVPRKKNQIVNVRKRNGDNLKTLIILLE